MTQPAVGAVDAPTSHRSRGLVDPRLVKRAVVTRRYLAAAVAVGVASTGCLIAQAVLLANVVDRLFLHGATLRQVVPALIGLGGAFAARALLAWAGNVAAHRTSATVTSLLRGQVLTHILRLGPSWLSGEQTGELSLTATRGIGSLDTYFSRVLPQAILAALAPVAVLAWVAWADWVSFVILAVTVATVPLFMVLLGLAARDRTEEQWTQLSRLGARFLDVLQGLPTLRGLRRARSGRRTIEAATDQLRQATLSTLRVAFLSSLALEVLAAVGTALVALFLGLRLLHGTVPLSTALAILVLAPEVYLPLRRAAAEFHASTEGQAAAARVLDILDEVVPGGTIRTESVTTIPPGLATWDRLEISGLTVCYSGRAGEVLSGIDLTVARGEHIALTGESGSGKSTLLGVLLGFVSPNSGSVSIGDIDLATVDVRWWRRQIAWVPQRPSLFRGSLADNVAMGDRQAGERAVLSAMETAGLGELLVSLPDGSDTVVGEGGLTLSAGERQRVAIARAVLRDAPVILLDEPASHLDRDRQEALSVSLAPHLDGRTVLVAAHRGGLMRRIDRVVTLSGGTLVPPGLEPIPSDQAGSPQLARVRP